MKITLLCSCGASASFEDDKNTFIFPGGLEDQAMRKFQVELDADKWLDKHSNCLKLSSIKEGKE